MTTQASLPNAFTRSAIKFAVAESDYLVMVCLGISTLESMAYRFPKAEDVEEFMQSQVLPTSGFREDDGRIITFPRHPVELWQTFRTGEDAKGIRELWSYSKEVCKAELEQLATADGGSKPKTSMAVASAMEEKAISKMMPAPMQIGRHCLPLQKPLKHWWGQMPISSTFSGSVLSALPRKESSFGLERCPRTGQSWCCRRVTSCQSVRKTRLKLQVHGLVIWKHSGPTWR